MMPERRDQPNRPETGSDGRTVIVCGYLGAGKSHLIGHLSGVEPVAEATSFQDHVAVQTEHCETRFVEASPWTSPDGWAGVASGAYTILSVVDAVNAAALADDPVLGSLIAAQIAAGDGVWLNRADVGDAAGTERLIRDLTAAPVWIGDAPALPDVLRLPAREAVPNGESNLDLSERFTTWRHSGAAVLTAAALDGFLAGRPSGAYRIKGRVAGPDGGHSVDVFGRVRQIAPLAECTTTELLATGLKDRFSRREMDLAFAEAVMAASYNRGMIACR